MKHRHTHIKRQIKNFKPKTPLLKRPVFWIILLLIVLISATFYFLFLFPGFQVKAIIVSGNTDLQSKVIETAAWENIQKNLLGIHYKTTFMINNGALRKALLASFPEIEDVNVQKQWPQNISLKVTERSPVGVFCVKGSECYFIDKNGVVYQKLDYVDPNDVIFKKDIGGSEVSLGKTIVDKNTMDGVLKVIESLRTNFQLGVKEVLTSNPLIVTTQENWPIYFDPTRDMNLQITKLNALLKDQISVETRKTLQYIYLQYKDRAYYK